MQELVNGVRLHYQRSGHGPDVVMVHGLGANLAFWGLRIAPPLRRLGRVTTYVLRGHGFCSMPRTGYGPDAMARDLDSLLDAIGADRVHLVGHSFGGDIALEYAVAHPARVASLALADPVLLGDRGNVPRGSDWLRRRLDQLGASQPEHADGELLLDHLASLRGLERDASHRQAIFVPFELWKGSRRAADAWRRLVRTTTLLDDLAAAPKLKAARLRRVRHPVLVLYGGQSVYRFARPTLAESLPDCRFVTIPDAGHFHPLVCPAAVTRALERFLTEMEARAPTGVRA